VAKIVLVMFSLEVDELFKLGDKKARDLDYLSHLANWVIIVALGVNGNELREKNLLARGYWLRGVSAGSSPNEALASHKEQEQREISPTGLNEGQRNQAV
jgi:hypothetical protein